MRFSSKHFCVEGFRYAKLCEVTRGSVPHLKNTFQFSEHVGRVQSTNVFESAMAFSASVHLLRGGEELAFVDV